MLGSHGAGTGTVPNPQYRGLLPPSSYQAGGERNYSALMSCLTLPPFSTQALKFKAPASSTRTDEREHHSARGVGAVLSIFINISASPFPSSSACNCPGVLHICRIPPRLLPSSRLPAEPRHGPLRRGSAVLIAPLLVKQRDPEPSASAPAQGTPSRVRARGACSNQGRRLQPHASASRGSRPAAQAVPPRLPSPPLRPHFSDLIMKKIKLYKYFAKYLSKPININTNSASSVPGI